MFIPLLYTAPSASHPTGADPVRSSASLEGWLAGTHKGRDRPCSVDIAARPCVVGTDVGTEADRERSYRAADSQQAVLPPPKGEHQVPGQFWGAPRAERNVDDHLPTGMAVGRHHRSLSPIVEDEHSDDGVAGGDGGAWMQ